MNPPSLSCTRRQCLRAALLAVPAAMALAGCRSRGVDPADGGPEILDTHTHFYDPRRPGGIPWPPADDAFLNRPVLPDEFRRLAWPHGVRGTVVVEASPREEDNEWVLGLAARDPLLRGLVGHLKPGRPGFDALLERWARNPRFRGIRTGGWEVGLAPDDPAFLRDLSRLADRDLTLDVLVGPDQLPRVARLASALPTLRIVVDHCANLRVDGGPPPPGWVEGIRACARHPRVFLKVSGLVEGTGRTDGTAPADPAFYAPVLEAAWEVFGDDRVVFGSNWPVSARFAPYATVLAIAGGFARGRGRDAAARFLAGNAVEAYRLPGAGGG